jgi:hypothetical protein
MSEEVFAKTPPGGHDFSVRNPKRNPRGIGHRRAEVVLGCAGRLRPRRPSLAALCFGAEQSVGEPPEMAGVRNVLASMRKTRFVTLSSELSRWGLQAGGAR